MKLYYATGTCSLAPRIVLNELGLPFEAVKVDIRAKEYAGGDYRKVNPKGSVPAIQLDNTEVLTENAVILQYLSDLKPEAGMMPKPGTWERVRTQEWLNYVSSEIHKSFSIMFGADRMVTPGSEGNTQLKAAVRAALGTKLAWLNEHFAENDYLMGSKMTAPDAYLYTTLRWSKMMEVDLTPVPNVVKFVERMGARPAVKTAVEAEGMKV